jgi:hypothetical protein
MFESGPVVKSSPVLQHNLTNNGHERDLTARCFGSCADRIASAGGQVGPVSTKEVLGEFLLFAVPSGYMMR